jgi:hypothetical protein
MPAIVAGELLVDPITIDGLNENDFRRSIENMLRHGEADSAATKLRALIEPYAGDGNILPSRFLTVSPGDVSLSGWDRLGERIRAYDRPDHRISALSISVTDPDEAGARPDDAGKPVPCIETGYFSDDAYPFSEAGRSDLLDGYSLYGCEWQGDFEETDSTLSVDGIEDLYGAVARLEAKLLASKEPCEQEIRAGSLGACYLSVLLHQAVRDTVRVSGLPRPLCVMAGNNGVYPFFDAPVVSSEECLDDGAVQPLANGMDSVPGDAEDTDMGETANGASDEGSLLSLSIRKGNKKPVIMLDPSEAEAATRLYESDAAQHMADAGKSARVGHALTGLNAADAFAQDAAFAHPLESAEDDGFEEIADSEELPGSNPYFLGNEPPYDDMSFAADDETGADRADHNDDRGNVSDLQSFVYSDENDEIDTVDPIHAYDEAAVPEAAENSGGEPADYPGHEGLIAVEESVPLDQAPGIESSNEFIDAGLPPDQPQSPDLTPRGHSLRARIVQTPQSQTTLGDRIVAALQWIENWLTRRRK